MKALRNFKHNGVFYTPGQNVDGIEIVTPQQIAEIKATLVANKKPSDLPLLAHDLEVLNNKITQIELDELTELGLVGPDDAPLPKDGTANVTELKYKNYEIQEGDQAAEKQFQVDQASNRAANVSDNPVPPSPQPSQVVEGDPADAAAAIAKSNAAAADAPAVAATAGGAA